MDVKKHKLKRKRLCRICLCVVKKKAVSLFSTFRNSSIFSHIISINVNIRVIDGLPDKICSQCLAELETALNFKEKCENNNNILLTSIADILIDNNSQQLKKPEVSGHIEVKKEPEDHSDTVLDHPSPYVHASDFPEDTSTQIDYHSSNADDFPNSEANHNCGGVNFDEDEEPLSALKLKPFKSKAIDLHLQCDDCKDFFKSKCKLQVHWKKVHTKAQLVCQTCRRDFKSYLAYHKHQKNKSASCTESKHFRIEGLGKLRKFYCKECNYASKRIKDIISHKVTHTGERPYSCDICGKTHTQLSSLHSHKETAHKEYKFEVTCQYCGKFLKGRNAVYKHLKNHRNNQVQCKLCNKVLKNKQTWKAHMIRHDGVKTKQCELCSKTFYTQAEISTHKRYMHSRIETRMHACDECGYRTPRKASLVKHRAKHSGDNICCLHCGVFLENQEKLIEHEWRHNNKNFVCECGEKFYRRDNLRRHVNKKHVKKEMLKGKTIITSSGLAQSFSLHVTQRKIKNVKEECSILPSTIVIQKEIEKIEETVPSNVILQEISKDVFLFQHCKVRSPTEEITYH